MRGIYQQIEQRIVSSEGGEALLVQWRVSQAIAALVKRHGSIQAVRRRALTFVLALLAALVLLLCEATGTTSLLRSMQSGLAAAGVAVGVALSLLGGGVASLNRPRLGFGAPKHLSAHELGLFLSPHDLKRYCPLPIFFKCN